MEAGSLGRIVTYGDRTASDAGRALAECRAPPVMLLPPDPAERRAAEDEDEFQFLPLGASSGESMPEGEAAAQPESTTTTAAEERECG